jgi:hypothetical protein
MKSIYKSQLPKTEADVRADLNKWRNQLANHALTVGKPAPFPDYELLRFLEDGFVVIEEDESQQNEPETPEQIKEARIQELKQMLKDTDYVALADYDKSKPEVLEQRKAWREEIRSLENK